MLIHLEPADIERFTAAGEARHNDLMDSARDAFNAMAAAVREGDRDGVAASAVVVGDTLLQLCVTSAATWEAAENKSRFLGIMLTPLAECREVRGLVVLRVVVTVSRREDDAGGASSLDQAVGRLEAAHRLPGTVTPPLGLIIPPAAVTKVQHHAPVWPAAGLAPTLGPPKPDRGRQLAPVDRIEPAVVPADRHETSRRRRVGAWCGGVPHT
ncbi:MAG: hypothetical protein ACRYGP_30445 [Janthinobacterium lividum]